MELTFAAVTIESGVADVILTASGKANRMGPDYWSQMPELFSRLDADDSVRAIVIRGGAEHFTYGLDLPAMGAELAQFLDPTAGAAVRTKLLAAIRRLQAANTAVVSCRKPVIAAVHGWCIGGGVDLITACDIRLCSKDAKFSVREVRLAMVADVGTLARLPAIVGQGVARELAFTGDDFDAARALRIGLVSEVYESAASVVEAAKALAGRIAKNPPLVVQGIKEVMNAGSEPAAAASLSAVALWNSAFLPSLDVQEAIGAFLEKREPRFSGQ
jgi:enoyl-CoA hydratase